ncbi:MAG: flagellar hook-associated protein FlgK [Oscillospiraceae bacterium]|jgi:flagellar hook-associated protein 1 FlgK|nr:flagellar hook-associated protein FlgK [Oscillospiraceae bacterium]
MRSTFHGLNIANSGLFMAQKQIDLSSHNVANANTVGYSRQRFVTSAIDPLGYLMRFAPLQRGAIGGGVEPLSLDQIRDIFLDRQYRTEFSKSSYWATRASALYYIEDVFNSVDAASLDGVMSDFFNALQELSKNSTDEAIRTNVIAQAKKMIDCFRMYYDQLTDLMEQQDSNLYEETKHVNNLLTRLASLNDDIMKFEVGGNTANDLRDERNLILDELSSFMDISYAEVSFEPPLFNIFGRELATFKLYVGSDVNNEDNLLCDGKYAQLLVMEEEEGLNEIADNNEPPIITHQIYLASGIALLPENIEGYETGILKSYQDMRDGAEMDNQGIPYFINQLNIMVNALVTEFNSIHSQGYTMPYSGAVSSSDSVSGIDFFDPDGVTANTIAISEDVLLSAFNIAASSEYVTMEPDGHLQTGNNENALALIRGIKERSDLDDVGSFEGYFKNFLGNLASEVSLAYNMRDAQEVLIVSIGNQRSSIMTVSLDEEMTDLIRFQHAYNAAARCITVMDEALDKLINGTGRVGL